MGALEPIAAHAFGKYTLVAKLATGGMAEIFLARLQGTAGFEKLVCIKRILPHLAKDEHLVNMFLAEARIAAQITHSNVCQVFELGDIDGRYFIAMEYLEGVPLSCFRRRDMYPTVTDPRFVAGAGAQACEGLHHAHQLKKPDGTPLEVVHRDVSANNLFATADGVVKVLDFGIAKIQDASVRTTTGSVKGTYAYMAPEQLRGEKLDRRVDVFALGTVLWELLARRHLFKRDTEFLTFQAITTDPIPDIRELRPDVSAELATVISMALARDREQRFPTARAFGEALTEAVVPLGGALTSLQISTEITRAFESRLADQHRLVRVAREGGTLDLSNELGPSVGHGTELVSTPVSGIGASSTDPDLAPPFPYRASTPMPVTGDVTPVPRAPTRPATSPTRPPAPEHSSSPLRIVLVAISALALGGGAAVVYLKRSTPTPSAAISSADAASVAVIAPVVIDAAMPSPVAIDAAMPATVVDARTPTITVDAEEAAVVPPDAATVTTTKPDIGRRRPPPRPPAVPSGPPGSITIDSSPVYAVIYIDGKSYGETPLVNIKLPPGKHAVRAVSASGSVRNLSITIESGKAARTRRIEW